MGKVVKSIAYGYAAAALGGLAVGLVGAGFGLSETTVAAAAVPTGIVFGTIGLSMAWWRPVLARIRRRSPSNPRSFKHTCPPAPARPGHH